MARSLAMDCADVLHTMAEQRVQLVLDDFHVIKNPLVYRFLVDLVERCEEHIQIFICTKSAIPPDFARLVVSQRTAHIGSETLAFTHDEICALMRQLGTNQDPDVLAHALYSRIEGWPVGVMFVLLHLRSSSASWEDDLELIATTPYMRDYFMHELFRKLPFDLQHFLTATAVLEYLQPEVCNLLTGANDAAAQLAYLEQENLFVIRTTGNHRFYRYHTLFRDFLRNLSTSEARRELAEKAAHYYLGTPDRRWAVEYALFSENGSLLRQTLELVGSDLLEQGEHESLRHYLDALEKLGEPPSPEITRLIARYDSDRHQTTQLNEDATPLAPPTIPSQQLVVHAFGPFRVITPSGKEMTWRTKKTRELFAYLYHRRGEAAGKEQLMDILWPQAMPTNATSLLHTSLYNIRKSLADFTGLSGLITHGKMGYAMEMSLVICHRGVLDSFSSGTLLQFPQGVEPSELYAGPYLEDIDALWCTDARAHYSGVMLRVYRGLAEESMSRGNYPFAAALLRTAAAQEPYDEGIAGLLIRSYAAMGEMKNAMAQYATLKGTLARELEIEPSEEVTRIYRECLIKRLGNRRST